MCIKQAKRDDERGTSLSEDHQGACLLMSVSQTLQKNVQLQRICKQIYKYDFKVYLNRLVIHPLNSSGADVNTIKLKPYIAL